MIWGKDLENYTHSGTIFVFLWKSCVLWQLVNEFSNNKTAELQAF